MAVKAILFDFDGTIADTRDALVGIVNDLSEEFNYQPVTPEDLNSLKHLSSREIVSKAQVPSIKIPFILKRIRAELNQKMKGISPIDGLKESLYQLKNQGYCLGIVTSNVEENVRIFLENNCLESTFDFICAETTLFGKSKVINRALRDNYLKVDEVIYIGDETRDIQAAKRSKIKVIAVGWGFNSPEILARHEPNFLICHPQELMGAIAKANAGPPFPGKD